MRIRFAIAMIASAGALPAHIVFPMVLELTVGGADGITLANASGETNCTTMGTLDLSGTVGRYVRVDHNPKRYGAREDPSASRPEMSLTPRTISRKSSRAAQPYTSADPGHLSGSANVIRRPDLLVNNHRRQSL